MHNLNLEKVNLGLVQSLRMLAAVRRLLGPNSDVKNELISINREVREAAAECQRVLKLTEKGSS